MLHLAGAPYIAPPPVGGGDVYEDTFNDPALALLTSRLSLAPTHTPFLWVQDSSSTGDDKWSANGSGFSFRNGGSGHLMYVTPDLGAADHWIEIDVGAMATGGGGGFFIRGAAGVGLTYVGCELGGAGGAGLRLEAYEGSSSARRLIDLQGYVGKTIRVEARGTTFEMWTEWGFAETSSNHEVKVDAAPLIQSGTYAGIYGHGGAGGNEWATAFRAGTDFS